MLRARLPLNRVVVLCSCAPTPPSHGVPCFLFYRRRESAGYSGGRGEEREREKNASRVGSFLSFMQVPPIL